MEKIANIKISDLIGSSLGISTEDGQMIFDKIQPLMKDDQQVVISFDQLEVVVALFLNVAIGQLYGTFSEEKIEKLVSFEDISVADQELLDVVKENAKQYFKSPKSYDEAWAAVLNEN